MKKTDKNESEKLNLQNTERKMIFDSEKSHYIQDRS